VEHCRGDHRYPTLLVGRQELVQRGLIEQGVPARQHQDLNIGLLDERGQQCGVLHPCTNRSYYAFCPKFREGRVSVMERSIEMVASVVEIQHVHPLQTHPKQRLLETSTNPVAGEVPHPAVGRRNLESLIGSASRVLLDQEPANLRRERERIPGLFAEELPEPTLRMPDPVMGCRVEVTDAAIPCRCQSRSRRLIIHRLEQTSERPPAQAKLGDVNHAPLQAIDFHPAQPS